jgi:hypothetical protein
MWSEKLNSPLLIRLRYRSVCMENSVRRVVGGVIGTGTVYREYSCKNKRAHNYALLMVIALHVSRPTNVIILDGRAMKTTRLLKCIFPDLPQSQICVVEWDRRTHQYQEKMGLATCVYGNVNAFLRLHPNYVAGSNCAYLDYTSPVSGCGGWMPQDDWLIILSGTRSNKFVLAFTVSVRDCKSLCGEVDTYSNVRKNHVDKVLMKTGFRIENECHRVYHRERKRANSTQMLFCIFRLTR